MNFSVDSLRKDNVVFVLKWHIKIFLFGVIYNAAHLVFMRKSGAKLYGSLLNRTSINLFTIVYYTPLCMHIINW